MEAIAECQGLDVLLEKIDRAVGEHSTDRIVEGVKNALEDVLGGGGLRLSERFKAPCDDSYARRLLHRCERTGYTVIAMIWGPSQGTPVHDHAGMWCVECVAEGEIDVVQYDLVESSESRHRFEAQQTIRAGIGAAGALIPPFEYHTIENPSTEECAITIHVYANEMTSCRVFVPGTDGWYQGETKSLSYSA